MTLHVVIAATMAAGLAYCRRRGLPVGRYDRSQPGVTVEVLTPESTGARIRGRRLPTVVHRLPGARLTELVERDLADLEVAA